VIRRDTTAVTAAAMATAVALMLTIGGMMATGHHAGAVVRNDRTTAHAAADAAQPAQVPILCYHYIRGGSDPLRLLRVFGYVVLSLPLLDDSELWTTGASNFERQMEYLQANGYHTVSLYDVNEWQVGRGELPPRPVVLTFDDGDASVYEYAFPILKRMGMRATIFVVTGQVGKTWGEVDCLDWGQLREMHESGVFDVESHTHDLHYKIQSQRGTRPVFLAACEDGHPLNDFDTGADAVRDDLVRSRVAIQSHLGHTPRFLAWPYGFGNPQLDWIAREVGFVRACGLRDASNGYLDVPPMPGDTPRFEMPRYAVTARTSIRTLRAMLAGTDLPGV
jgi:peptidoglycan/xylan/chitin deacetylase (PgdA/CDA1 family)